MTAGTIPHDTRMATRCLDDAEWRRLSVADYLRLKLTVTVMRTSIGAQLSSVGSKSH